MNSISGLRNHTLHSYITTVKRCFSYILSFYAPPYYFTLCSPSYITLLYAPPYYFTLCSPSYMVLLYAPTYYFTLCSPLLFYFMLPLLHYFTLCSPSYTILLYTPPLILFYFMLPKDVRQGKSFQMCTHL